MIQPDFKNIKSIEGSILNSENSTALVSMDIRNYPFDEIFPEILLMKSQVLSTLERELPAQLYYHNVQHTKDVCKAVELLCVYEGVQAEELKLLWTAALFHDTGFMFEYNNNEIHACSYARKILTVFRYPEEFISRVCQLIMATNLPQSPTCRLEEILCDADLDYLGRDDFFITALRLHREWSENSGKKIPIKDWYEMESKFMRNHKYFTLSAQKLRNHKKSKNFEQIQELTEMIDAHLRFTTRKCI